ncbi:hypothetical protein FCH28_13525 [Streptomyces piniterrae]|uniref:Uncharacterized protein n=1 Tax=Streptomyces piniterrae TaxID=2571125 RepID=A0A4U0NIV7_9ACTN|nr:hypothetical protein [Streptomyces piniterrae]TJZ54199.1 hypothetical protein FCH28_13525 [Streptomyces piniterrae]
MARLEFVPSRDDPQQGPLTCVEEDAPFGSCGDLSSDFCALPAGAASWSCNAESSLFAASAPEEPAFWNLLTICSSVGAKLAGDLGSVPNMDPGSLPKAVGSKLMATPRTVFSVDVSGLGLHSGLVLKRAAAALVQPSCPLPSITVSEALMSSETPKLVTPSNTRSTVFSVALGGCAGQIGFVLKRTAAPALTQSFVGADAVLPSAADAVDAAVRP